MLHPIKVVFIVDQQEGVQHHHVTRHTSHTTATETPISNDLIPLNIYFVAINT